MARGKRASLPGVDPADANAVRQHEGTGDAGLEVEGDTLPGNPTALTIEQLAANEGVQMRVTELVQYLRAHPVSLSGELASLAEILLDRF